MRLLGIDFGFKRIGVAVAETSVGIASPRPAMVASGTLKTDASAIAELAHREQVAAVVLGVPESEDDRMARICRTLAGHLEEKGLTVHLVDESLSSVQAEATLRQDDLKASQRRKLRDGEAARLILERYMNA